MRTIAVALSIAFSSLLLVVVRSQNSCPTELSCLGCVTRTRIICTSGGLTTFPNLPPDLKQDVEELSLRNNDLTAVMVEDLVNYTNLETINLSFNNISYIEPGSFNLTIALSEIDLSNNQLTSLPDEIFANTQLITLVAANNMIEDITSATFTGVQDFATINLDGNRIETITSGTFSEIGRIDQLVLRNNPLVCDCRLRWLLQFVDRNSTQSPLSSSLGTCSVPVLSLTDVQVSSLMTSDFECDCIPPCINGTCNMVVGECECSDGFIGNLCDSVCPAGSYGADCIGNCTCVAEQESSPCDHIDGTCHCLPGYNGSSCEMECLNGYFGQNCAEVCQCQNEASCDFRTGSCDCTAGWMGRFCNTPCLNGTFGPNCSQTCTCSVEHESSSCDRIDGSCFCAPGYTGGTCDIECLEGTYGQGCDEECECQNGASCDPITGQCTCTSGWIGELCNKSCPAGSYGMDCQQSCTCIEDHQIRTCDHISGKCQCLSNYTGQNCEVYQELVLSTGTIVASVLGGVVGISVLSITIVAVMIAGIYFTSRRIKMKKTRFKISPSQQFQPSDSEREKVNSLEPFAPPNKQTLLLPDHVTSPVTETTNSNLSSL